MVTIQFIEMIGCIAGKDNSCVIIWCPLYIVTFQNVTYGTS